MAVSRMNGNCRVNRRRIHSAPFLVASTVAFLLMSNFAGFGRRCLAGDKPEPAIETITNSIGMKLAKIPAGKFKMGSPETEDQRALGEFQQEVTIAKPFYIGVYEVTQEQFEKVMEANPSIDQGENLPVGSLSWGQAMEFCETLSENEDQTYRLPTEAEWEYACRAGTTTVFHYGDKLSYEEANINAAYPYGTDVRGSTLGKFKPVGSYKPNAFGLYDMHGNAWEFCLDAFRQRPDVHVLRGGGGDAAASSCRSANRWWHSIGWPWTGFRVVRTVEPDKDPLVIPIAHELNRADRFTSKELIAKVDEALAKPAVELLPPTVIFPVVDGDRHVRADGAALSAIAGFAAAYGPERRMAICLPSVLHRMLHAGCLKPGATIDDETIQLVLASLGVDSYVVPQLITKDGKLELTQSIQKLNGQEEKPIPQTIEADKLAGVPELIARAVLEHAGAKLSEAQTKHLATVTVRKTDDLELLSKLLRSKFAYGDDHQEWEKLLQRNPRCLPAWHLYISESLPPKNALARYKNFSRMLACDRLQIAARTREPVSQDALIAVLELAPKFHGDTYYYWSLARIAANLNDDEVATHLLKAWRENDNSYCGDLSRADFLRDWAWTARRGDYNGNDKADQLFAERMGAAMQEIEHALASNPRGWEAHAHWISVGMGLNVPESAVDEHFDAAIKLRPAYADAYQQKLNTLRPNSGEPPDLPGFALMCFKTDFWDEGIIELGRSALEGSNLHGMSMAYTWSGFRDPEKWEALLEYVASADRSVSPKNRKLAANLLAKYGGYGGHHEEVAAAFRQLEKEGYDKDVFSDGFTYAFLRDRVFAETEKGQTQVRAALRASLDAGDFEKAQQWLDKLDGGAAENAQLRERSQRAIDVGRDVQAGQTVELSAAQIHALFEGIDDRWKVEGDELVCRLPAGAETLILCPFGMGPVEISGTISWLDRPEQAEIHTHTRTVRDDVYIRYTPHDQLALSRRNRWGMGSEPLRGDAASFRIARGDKVDHIFATGEKEWTPKVFDDARSGFGFQITAAKEQPAVVKLAGIRIKPSEAE